MKEKHQYFNGVKFTLNEKTGYYFNRVVRRLMHRYVWEYYNGKIPPFYQIHHIDGDTANNDISNLEMLRVTDHQKTHERSAEENEMYGQFLDDNARKKAAEWHRSAEGREWHKQHYESVKGKMQDARRSRKPSEKQCINCGRVFSSLNAAKYCSNHCRTMWNRKAKKQ